MIAFYFCYYSYDYYYYYYYYYNYYRGSLGFRVVIARKEDRPLVTASPRFG